MILRISELLSEDFLMGNFAIQIDFEMITDMEVEWSYGFDSFIKIERLRARASSLPIHVIVILSHGFLQRY
jgi:hypothetical protein